MVNFQGRERKKESGYNKKKEKHFDPFYILKAEISHLIIFNLQVVSCHMILILLVECEKMNLNF